MQIVVDPSVFDFIDELAAQIRAGRVHRTDSIRLHSRPVVFCDSFFGQFFGSLGCDISGFGTRSRESVAAFAIRSREQYPNDVEYSKIRILTVRFEKFCEIHDDIEGNGYGRSRSSVSYGKLHDEYLPDLLDLIIEWSQLSTDRGDITAAAVRSKTKYAEAVRETEWLTRPTPSWFDSLKRTLLRRTN